MFVLLAQATAGMFHSSDLPKGASGSALQGHDSASSCWIRVMALVWLLIGNNLRKVVAEGWMRMVYEDGVCCMLHAQVTSSDVSATVVLLRNGAIFEHTVACLDGGGI